MSSILQKILAEKKHEVARLKEESIPSTNRTPLSLRASIQAKAPIGIIAEIKRHSPSKGALHESVDPIEQAKEYERAGAAAISVLTDEPFFKGRFEDLAAVREAVNIPILCKDFIIDPIQIKKAKSVGADVILLIVSALTQSQLQDLYKEAKQQGLEVLVEVHDEEELQRAVETGAEIIGVNNRNLSTFKVSLLNTERIANSSYLTNQLLISESGMATREDVTFVQGAGAHGILVGETLMKSKDIQKTMQELSLQESEITQ